MIYDLHRQLEKLVREGEPYVTPHWSNSEPQGDMIFFAFKSGFAEGCKAMLSLLLGTDVEGLPDRALEAVNEVRRLLNGDE